MIVAAIHPLVFILAPVILLAVVTVVNVRMALRKIDRGHASGFFDGELERQLAARGERRANHRLGSSWDWPER